MSATEPTEAEYKDFAGAEAGRQHDHGMVMPSLGVAHSPAELRVDAPGHCQVV